MKMFSTTLMALIGVFLLQSCDVTIGYDYDYGYPNCGYYGEYCGPYYGRGWYRRGYYHGPRRHHHHHRGHHNHGGHHLVADVALTTSNQHDPAALLAADYGISRGAAKKIIAIAGDKESRKALLRDFGFSKDDLNSIRKMEMPSRNGVEKMANALGEKPAVIERIISDFLKDAKAGR